MQFPIPIVVAVLVTALAPATIAAQQPSPKSAVQVAEAVVEIWNTGDYALGDQLFTPGATLHYRGRDIPIDSKSGSDVVRRWRAGFPDFHFTIEDTIVQGDKVVLRIPFTGTHRGTFMGLEPTGKKISVTETLIVRVKDGQVAEMWEDYDEYGMRLQLGLIKAP